MFRSIQKTVEWVKERGTRGKVQGRAPSHHSLGTTTRVSVNDVVRPKPGGVCVYVKTKNVV